MKTIKNPNKNGRPKKPIAELRDYLVSVRLNTAEYYSAKAKATQAGVTLSEYLRLILRKSQVRQRLTPDQNRLILSLTAMGNNLNQLTKRANQAGYLAVGNELQSKISELDNVIKLIEK